YTKENIFQYNNISYQVNTNGIGSRTVKLRLYVDDNLQANYSLSTKYAEDNLIPKSHKKEIRYQGLSAVESYDLAQNYPNPFNPSTTIKYQLPEDGMVTLKIYDILGREIKTLVNEQKSIGRYEVKFDASDLATGVYIYRLKVNDFVSVKKMVLVK
ncbi:T9SS type A sorting domain-containing protein, partial [bacterium BMS3Abin03]|nr:T9SS type A sorting domain-containing protein [bacterium BMS3Abin03]